MNNATTNTPFSGPFDSGAERRLDPDRVREALAVHVVGAPSHRA